jgi:diguanylate cyclase
LFGTLAIAVSLLFPQWEPIVFLLLGISTTVALIVSVIVRRPSLIWPWASMATAFVLFIVNGAARGSLQTLGNLTATRSLLPDILALPAYALLAIGLLGFSRSRARGAAQTSVVLDGFIAAVALASLAWAFVVEPVLMQRLAPNLVKIVLTAYPSMSIFLVVVTLRIVLNADGKRAAAFWLCVGAMSFMFLGDALYMFADMNLLHVLPYAAAFLGAGATALHPSMRQLTEPAPPTNGTSSPGRAALVAGALMVTALLTLQYRLFTASDRIVMFALFFALTSAVVLRIIQALRVAAQSEARLEFQANHDELTGLPNRRVMEQHLSRLLQQSRVDDTHVALLFLDIDRFKLVNDTLGHRRGDDLLVEVAGRLRSHVRPTDLVIRIGGDEFMILLDHVAATSEAMDLANRLRLCLKEPFVLGGIEFYISASVGLAFASGDDPSATAEALVRDADTAMYQAKEAGRDKVAVFDESMREEVSERVELVRDLRSAVSLGQLHLVYQPIVALPRGPSVGVEALVRWAHPVRGVLSPSQFIPLAEDSGMIAEIGNWVLEEAVSQLAAWCRYAPEMEDIYVSVNLSSAQLRDDGIVERVADLLAIHGLPGSSLCLELTESMAMQDPIASAAIFARLRRLGVGVALDDFGAEYSSLAYLRRLPVTVLKIDKSFVDSLLHEDTADSSLIAAVVAMANSLGITTVAEGVETSAQAQRLLHLGVDAVQGFLFSRPVTADKLLGVTASLSERRLTLVCTSPR